MALPAIPNHVAGFMLAIQTTAGTAETLTNTTDGVYPDLSDGLPPAPFTFDYAYDGNRGRSINSLLNIPALGPIGRSGKFEFKTWAKGAGATYSSSSVLPPNEFHRMLQISGFDATFSTDHWAYTLTAPGTGYSFGTFGYYAQGKSHILRDVVADWAYEIPAAGVPTHTFSLNGVVSANRATLSLPTITYPKESVLPPTSAGAVYVIGDWTAAVVQKGGFKLGRQLGNPRLRSSDSNSHLGWVPTGFKPTMQFSVEQSALVNSPFHTSGGVDPDKLREAATSITVSQKFGTTPNAWKVEVTNAQLTGVTPNNDGAVAMWDLDFSATSASVLTVTAD